MLKIEKMDNIGEENGNSNLDNLSEANVSQASNMQNNSTATTTVLTTGANVVQFLPAHMQAQSVIQANQSSVIQTAANVQPVTLAKGGVLYVSKPNTVIHTTSGNSVQVQIKPEPNTTPIMDTNSEESSDDDSPRRRREFTRRPSYNKILNDISGPDISGGSSLQIQDGGIPTLSTGGSSNTIIHLSQDSASAFYLPSNNQGVGEDQTRKREIRLQKNREAARECRRKKKEYIKCLENRVAVLENQNKALIEELKSLKELYCAHKND